MNIELVDNFTGNKFYGTVTDLNINRAYDIANEFIKELEKVNENISLYGILNGKIRLELDLDDCLDDHVIENYVIQITEILIQLI